MISLEELKKLVRTRRTSMLVDKERDVPAATIEALCELATWAPNHKRTWPWRFALYSNEGRARLGQAFVTDMNASAIGDEAKRAKTLTKYGRTPAILVVGCAPGDGTMRDDDRDAVAAGIQTFLLGATAAGLASYWSSAPVTDAPSVAALSGFEPGTRIISVIYLGWPSGHNVEVPVRPAIAMAHVTS